MNPTVLSTHILAQIAERDAIRQLGEHVCQSLNEPLKHASAKEVALALMVNIGGLYLSTEPLDAIGRITLEEHWSAANIDAVNVYFKSHQSEELSLEETVMMDEIYVWNGDMMKAAEIILHMRQQRKIREQVGGVQSQVTEVLEKKSWATLKLPLVGKDWKGIGPIISPHATGQVRIIRGPDGTLWDITLFAPLEHPGHLKFHIEKE